MGDEVNREHGSAPLARFVKRWQQWSQGMPPQAVLPVMQGPLKGKKWIVGSSNHGCWLGSYEHAKPIFLEETVTEGGVVFDVGAYVGFYTLLASGLVGPGGRVFAFEPLQRNLYYLKRHLQLNDIENTTVIEAAVSDRSGRSSFDEGTRSSMEHMASRGKRRVKTVSIDELVATGEVPSPDYIIMDIPGAETFALAGTRSTLERCHATIFLATHGGEIQRECRCFLESLGYQLQSLDGANVEESSKLLATYERPPNQALQRTAAQPQASVRGRRPERRGVMRFANRSSAFHKEEAMTSPEQTRDAWNKFAAGYDEAITPFSMRIAEDALRRVDIRHGMRFLDVAAGGGALSIPAARLGAHVLATDFSAAMVGRLNARAREEGLSNLESRVMDGQNLELEDNTFDISGSQLGIMLFPDRPRALGELARVTKPAGHSLMVVFGPPQNVEAFAFFFGAMRAAVSSFTPPQDSPIFSLQDPEELRREMAAAGLKDIRVETVDHGMEIQSATHLWDMLTSAAPPIGALVANLTEEQRAAVQQALDGMLRQRSGGGPAVLNMQVHIGIGTK